MVAVALFAAAPASAATVKVTVNAPSGVPATVKVGKRVLAKAPKGRTATFRVPAGKVKAPTFAFDGSLYEARVKRYRVTYSGRAGGQAAAGGGDRADADHAELDGAEGRDGPGAADDR